MWQCLRCRESVEDSFDVCWNCGTSKDGVIDDTFQRAEDVSPEGLESPEVHEVRNIPVQPSPPPKPPQVRKWGPPTCPTCGQADLYVKQDIASGSGDGIYLLPGLGALFYYATFDVVVCRFCGHTRLFASEDARNNLPGSDWTKLSP